MQISLHKSKLTGVRIKPGKEFRGQKDFPQDLVRRYSCKFLGNSKEGRIQKQGTILKTPKFSI